MRSVLPVLLVLTLGQALGLQQGDSAASAPPSAEPRTARSKKGLQVQMTDDALALGIAHAAINVQLGDLVRRSAELEGGAPDRQGVALAPGWTLREAALSALDAQVRPLAAAGVEVNFILLARATGDPELDALLLDPRYDPSAPNQLGAFRASDEAGRTFLRALVGALAQRYAPGSAVGQVRGWIVGNEVNSHWWWYNLGRATLDEVAAAYEPAVRTVHEAVCARDPDARTYVSLEHHWGIRFAAGDARQSCAGRALLEAFAARARAQGDFAWHVAYHPYPEDLFDCRFWLDESALPTPDSPRVTFKNLTVLTDHLASEPLRFAGAPRRVILSEQGFHCPSEPDGERLQAEAFARAWRAVEHNDGIDAFIYHRHVDHAHEGGLRFGLWTNAPGSVATPGTRRPLWELFRVCDTAEGPAALARALAGTGALHQGATLDERRR